jgi:catechol 2,3-dioxygenase-like lactoylglutathione lyase family enzyme
VTFVCKYVALHVPDLRAAESFYCEAFAMDPLFRESEREDGTWHTLRANLDWDDVHARGLVVHMVALRRDAFVLALFRGEPAPGTVFELCVGLSPEEVGSVAERLPPTATVIESRPDGLRFEDPFGFRWAVQGDDATFRSSGEIAGRWIDPDG